MVCLQNIIGDAIMFMPYQFFHKIREYLFVRQLRVNWYPTDRRLCLYLLPILVIKGKTPDVISQLYIICCELSHFP